MSISNMFSSTIFNVDNLQGVMTNSDLLQAQFDLTNDACIFINTQQMITKINKTSEIMFNTTSNVAIGKQVSEMLGTKNNHFMNCINKITTKASTEENKDNGTIGGSEAQPLLPEKLSQQLIGTYLISSLGRDQKDAAK